MAIRHLFGWIVAGTLALVSAAHAADVWHTATIKFIYPQGDGSFVLIFNSDAASCTSVSNPDYYTVRANTNGVTAEGLKLMYAAALMAKASDREVTINFSTSTNECAINRLQIGD
jgi:hypothetical protein